ncbi:MAG: radical SAM protein [Oscillospiraceae bacterium]|nr:radical SAM protein [Oscillospiraceae bacterium]
MTSPRYPLLGLARHRMEIDGAGVTTLVAGSGCPLSCAYCINKTLLCQPPTFVTAAELYEKTRVDDLYFRATGGGLCFGGGESLLHLDFYEALRPLCPDWRFTAETCLNLPPETVRRAAALFDAFIIDVKTLDPAIYRAYTGREPGCLIDNLRYLAETVGPARLQLRVPRIPGYNDEADRDRTVAALRELGLTQIERFPYLVRREAEQSAPYKKLYPEGV